MNKLILHFIVVLLFGAATAGADVGDVIPRPAVVQPLSGQFTFTEHTTICIDDESLRKTAMVLVDLLDKPMGSLKVKVIKGDRPRGSVLLTRVGNDPSLGQEGYRLQATPQGVTIRASTQTGLFYGIQSLRQMLPPEVESAKKVNGIVWAVPGVEITDAPRCRWRGLMLDCARHFFDKAEVEQLLDVMALYKMNVFHWHLTDDQGWRIQIKKYPKLTEQAAWRNGVGFGLDPRRTTHYRASDGKYGGYYTQDDVRDVVAYAAARHIMVVPEIEMPGHSLAALSVYPEFSSTTRPIKVSTRAGVMNGIYDPANEATFRFLDDVLTEVAGLFPGPYIHIGGDEVPKGPWKNAADCQALMKTLGLSNEDQLQSYFIKRVEKRVEAKGKQMVGWDEILEGGLAPGAVVMSWRGTGGAVTAAKAGHDVIFTPTSNAYLDYAQTRRKDQPITGGGYLPLAKVYALNPSPSSLSAEQVEHVLGVQGNMWTEYMPNLKQVELMAFPRAMAIAEVGWTPEGRRDYADFHRRLAPLKHRLDQMNVTCFDEGPEPAAPIGEWHPRQMGTTLHPLTWDVTPAVRKPGRYRVTLQYTDGDCRLDIAWIAISLAGGSELSRDTHAGTTGGSDHNITYQLKVPALPQGQKLLITAQVRSDGGTDSNGVVTVDPLP